jgi:pimeloyl-ACP methyl ester carboxylesterase
MTHATFSPRKGITLAYHRTKGKSKSLPGVIFMGGFRSDMTGTKATFLEEQCQKRNQSYLRFDYTGHGASSGKFEDGTIGAWLQDSVDALDHLTEGPQIVIGSSMGGWLMLLLGLERPDRVAGMIGLAAAPDFSEDIYHHEFSEEHRRHLAQKGIVYMPNDYADPHPLTRHLFEEARNHLLLNKTIPIHFPVRLIHGKKDADVPWQKSEKTLEKLAARDKKILWVEDGDHRLSRPQDLQLIDETLVELSHNHQLKIAANG